MPKYQYRISGIGQWTSGYGFSFMAITNTSGSNKKITLRSLEVFVRALNGGAVNSGNTIISWYKGSTPVTGEDLTATAAKADSAATIPSTFKVTRQGSVSGGWGTLFRRQEVSKKGTTVSTLNRILFGTAQQQGVDLFNSSLYRSAKRASASVVEPIQVNNGESYSVVMDHQVSSQVNQYTQPIGINLMVTVDGKLLTYNFVTQCLPGMALFSVSNTSTNVVKIIRVTIWELGTTDTPTIRLVPIGQLRPPDISDPSKKIISVTKMNSSYPDLLSSVCAVYSDVNFVPQGVPEIAISPASTGSPAGLNYLHTRDFWGPMYRNFLPEMAHHRIGLASDTLGLHNSHHWSDLLVRRAGITLNPGEGIALVSSAETAVGVQPSWSGWQTLEFGAQIDVESLYAPELTINGVVPGSRVKVVKVSDSSVLANDSIVGSSYSLILDETMIGQSVLVELRNASTGPYYKPWSSISTVSTAGVSFTALQELD